MTQELRWLESHIGSIDKAIEYADKFFWNLSIVEHGEEGHRRWSVLAGEDVILGADSGEAVDAFLYGMGLAYSVLPEKYAAPLKDDLGLDNISYCRGVLRYALNKR